MVPWSLVNQSLTVLWARYWALKDTSPREAEEFKEVILSATRALRA